MPAMSDGVAMVGGLDRRLPDQRSIGENPKWASRPLLDQPGGRRVILGVGVVATAHFGTGVRLVPFATRDQLGRQGHRSLHARSRSKYQEALRSAMRDQSPGPSTGGSQSAAAPGERRTVLRCARTLETRVRTLCRNSPTTSLPLVLLTKD